MGNYIILWYWTDAWRCKTITSNVVHPALYTDDPDWAAEKTVVGVYDASKPLDMFKLCTAICDEYSADCRQQVRKVLEARANNA